MLHLPRSCLFQLLSLPHRPLPPCVAFRQFNTQMREGTGLTHDLAFYKAWALEWVSHVNPQKGVWPKLPGHLRRHHATAKRNNSRRSATVRKPACIHAATCFV